MVELATITETTKLYRDQEGRYVIKETDGAGILFTAEELKKLSAAIKAATLYRGKT